MLGFSKKCIVWLGSSDEDIISVLVRPLMKANFNLKVFKDALDIIASLRDSIIPDFIALDFILNSIDGERLCRMLKSDKRFSSIPVILILSREALYLFSSNAEVILTKNQPDNLKLKMLAALSALRNGEVFNSDPWERADGESFERDKLPHEAFKLKKRFDAVFESNTAGIMELDNKMTILSVNNKFEDIFNVFTLDIIGENLVNAFPDWGRFVMDLAKRKTSSENVVITHKTNHIEITLSDIGIPLSETIGYFVMFKDVTEREQLQEKLAYYTQELEREVYKRTEELQLSNAELQKLGRLKNEYLSNVSHEMRTPLTTIKGFTETMLNREVSSDQVKEFLNIIIEESHRLERIVNDILDITRIQQGIMLKQLVFNEFDLTEEVNRVLRILLPLIEEKSIKLSIKSDRNQVILHADRDRIRQVIINIVENAIKFSNQGGKIDITLKKDGKSVVFYCRDNGIGIPENEKDRIFEKFYMVDGSDRKLCRGTGVGLYIAREIVNLHKGTIKLDEKIKKGSRFIVILPERSDLGELNEKDTGNR